MELLSETFPAIIFILNQNSLTSSGWYFSFLVIHWAIFQRCGVNRVIVCFERIIKNRKYDILSVLLAGCLMKRCLSSQGNDRRGCASDNGQTCLLSCSSQVGKGALFLLWVGTARFSEAFLFPSTRSDPSDIWSQGAHAASLLRLTPATIVSKLLSCFPIQQFLSFPFIDSFCLIFLWFKRTFMNYL